MKSLLFLLCGALALAADPKWISIENENFRIYSSANERETRDALSHFERVRGFFIQLTGAPPAKPVPVFVVVFGSEKEYQPFRFNEAAIAYYTPQADRDYIVMGKTGENAARIVTHEYAHLVFKHAGYNLPPWLNEGLAELFSTVAPLGKDTEFGNIIPGRLQELQLSKWIPFTTLLSVDHDSPYYNESKRAGMFYAESWALVHMLETTNQYRPRFGDVLEAIQNGTPSAEALEKIYGMPLSKLENELQGYVRGDSFRKLVTRIQLENIEKLRAQPAEMFAVRTLQADLLSGLKGKEPEARKRYEDLLREFPNQPEPWSGLGYIAWHEGKPQDAATHFAKAYELGSRSPKFLWDYGRLAAGSTPSASAQAFSELLKLEPKNSEARIELAAMQLNLRQYPAALATIRALQSVSTEAQRDRALYIRASAALQAGDRAEANKIADELKRLTKSPDYEKRADEMLRYLSQTERLTTASAPQIVSIPSDEATDSARPRVERQEAQPVTRADLEMILQDVHGSLVEMDCGNPARMILDTGNELKAFLVLNPERLIVTGRESGKAQFTCGKQPTKLPIRLQFTIAPEGSDAAGVARVVHFNEK